MSIHFQNFDSEHFKVFLCVYPELELLKADTNIFQKIDQGNLLCQLLDNCTWDRRYRRTPTNHVKKKKVGVGGSSYRQIRIKLGP